MLNCVEHLVEICTSNISRNFSLPDFLGACLNWDDWRTWAPGLCQPFPTLWEPRGAFAWIMCQQSACTSFYQIILAILFLFFPWHFRGAQDLPPRPAPFMVRQCLTLPSIPMSSSMLTRPCVIRINLNWTLCPGATWAIVVNNNGTRVWSNARQTKVRPGKQRGRWCSRAAASDTYWSSPPASAWDLRCAGRPSRAAWSALTHRRLFGPRVPATPMTSPHTLPQWSLLCKNMYEINEWYIWTMTIQCVWCTNIPMKQNKNVAGYKMKLKYGVRQKVNWYIDSRMEWNKMKVNTARCNNFT